MENKNFSPLDLGMRSPSQNKNDNTANSNRERYLEGQAEAFIAKIASALFWISTIGYSITTIAGFVLMFRGGLMDETIYSWTGIITIIASIIFYLITLLTWAKLKVNVNISRNLFVIKGLMLEDKEKNSPKQENPDTE